MEEQHKYCSSVLQHAYILLAKQVKSIAPSVQIFMKIEDYLLTFLGAVLFALLARGRVITALIKSKDQRSEEERDLVKGGALRGLIVEFMLLIPVGSFLLFIILPLFLKLSKFGDSLQNTLGQDFTLRLAFYAVVGVISYNFPFVVVREIATRLALNTLREFSDLHSAQPTKSSTQKQIEDLKQVKEPTARTKRNQSAAKTRIDQSGK